MIGSISLLATKAGFSALKDGFIPKNHFCLCVMSTAHRALHSFCCIAIWPILHRLLISSACICELIVNNLSKSKLSWFLEPPDASSWKADMARRTCMRCGLATDTKVAFLLVFGCSDPSDLHLMILSSVSTTQGPALQVPPSTTITTVISGLGCSNFV